MLEQKRALSYYLTRLQSDGRVTFTREEAQDELGLGRRAFLDAAERQQHKKHLINPRRGFYVVVPAQFFSWGAPPPSWYIDGLMRHEGRPYYVGLLKAAELHGATHQAVMAFQVVTDKRLPTIAAGRSTIAFYYRKDMGAIAAGVDQHKTDTGYMKVSSAELTLLDVLRYPHAAGGLDHIATVISDLVDRTNPQKLAKLSSAFEGAVVQRLGYLLDRFGGSGRASALHTALQRRKSRPWVELEPSRATDPDFRREPIERNQRWRVIVRRIPECDE